MIRNKKCLTTNAFKVMTLRVSSKKAYMILAQPVGFALYESGLNPKIRS